MDEKKYGECKSKKYIKTKLSPCITMIMLRPQFYILPRILGNPQTFLDDDIGATANVSVDFRTEFFTPSHNDSSAAASNLSSKEDSKVTLAVVIFSRHFYEKVIFSYLHVSRNFIVK
jgi:hypothetical protein